MFDLDGPYWLQVMTVAILWVLAFVGIVFSILYLNYFFVSLPLRRRERARLFLDLIETGVKSGRSPAQTVISISESRERSVGVWFHLLAGYLEEGLTPGQALARVPQLLPARMTAMLRAGESIGDLDKVLPACRQLLTDAPSQSRASFHFLMVGPMLGFPTGIIILGLFLEFVVPKFSEMWGWEIAPGAFFVFLGEHRLVIFGSQIALLVAAWTAAFLFGGGTRLSGPVFGVLRPIADYATYCLPWCRKRMQRDFCTMLAILLDSGVPEPEALGMAADCTANTVFIRRGVKAGKGLSQGIPLTEAIQMMDDSGEFKWRTAQATGSRGGFIRALAGWNEALDARAFRQEQAAAHVLSTGLVLLNGCLVGAIAIGVFQALTSMINEAVAW